MNIQDNDISLVSDALRSGGAADVSKAPGRSASITEESKATATEQTALDADAVQQLLEKAEEQLDQQGVSLKFTRIEDTGQYQVEVRDKNSDRVIRKIPSDEVVNLSRSFKALAGALVDKGV